MEIHKDLSEEDTLGRLDNHEFSTRMNSSPNATLWKGSAFEYTLDDEFATRFDMIFQVMDKDSPLMHSTKEVKLEKRKNTDSQEIMEMIKSECE